MYHMSISFEKLKLMRYMFIEDWVKLTMGFNLWEAEKSLLYQ